MTKLASVRRKERYETQQTVNKWIERGFISAGVITVIVFIGMYSYEKVTGKSVDDAEWPTFRQK